MKLLIPTTNTTLQTLNPSKVPALIAKVGERAVHRYIEFFTANIRNANTRNAYAVAVNHFADWCEVCGLQLHQLNPTVIALYVEQLGQEVSAPTVKQHLAAIRMLFDYLVIGQIMPTNPATAVRGPKHVVKKGKTPVLTPSDTRTLLDSIDTRTIAGLRDRALIGVMVYSFARVSAVLQMNVEDYFFVGRRGWFRLHEKGGKYHEVPTHHTVVAYLEDYLEVAGIRDQKRTPLFRSLTPKRIISERKMRRRHVLKMVKRRVNRVGLPEAICNHSFRATGITAYLSEGGSLEIAQQIAAHESPRTTKLYDRRSDDISLDEIERIRI